MVFDFVTETGRQRLKDRDAATRHLIRKRATQAAALTKKRERRIPKTNLLQLPPWTPNAGETLVRADDDETLRQKNAVSIWVGSDEYLQGKEIPVSYVPSPIISTGQLLSLLPSLQMQEALIGICNRPHSTVKDKIKTRKILQLTEPSFVVLIHNHYGHSTTLDAAMDCLAARARELLGDSTRTKGKSDSPVWHYGRALRSLKQDVDRIEPQRPWIEMWLAILVLALYELLDSSNQIAWILHSQGAAKILHYAGPTHITTKLYKNLLTIQTPIIATEALFTGSRCFLAQPEWQVALRNTITESDTFDNRGELFVSLMMLCAQVPNIFNDVTDTVLAPLGSDAMGVLKLQADLQMLKAKFAIWYMRWNLQLHFKCDDTGSEDRRLYSLVSSLVYSAIVDRLLLAITPSRMRELEHSANDLAAQALGASQATTLRALEAEVRLAYMTAVAESITATACQWRFGCPATADRNTVDLQVFADWCRMLGRPVHWAA